MANSLITCEVDLGQPGKQTGFLRVPHSVHRSAYGWIPVPIAIVANGEGPTVLMIAGNYGDEYEGQIALTKLVQELEPMSIWGRVIILTMANFPTAEAGLRTSPIDEGNLNRCFPGDPHGGPTDMIAHFIEQELMPLADYMVDLHSGGSSLFYPPTLLRGMGHNEEEAGKLKSLQAAFDLPYAWVFTGDGGGVDRDILHLTERGLRRILHALDMLPRYQPDAEKGARELNARGSVFAYDAGLFEPFKDIVDPVEEGEIVWQVQRGDAIYQIAADATRR